MDFEEFREQLIKGLEKNLSTGVKTEKNDVVKCYKINRNTVIIITNIVR